MSKARGFSLLEVLVTVAIVSLIATLTLPSLIRSMDRGRQSATLADIRVIGSGLERYAVDHGSYPVVSDLEALLIESDQANLVSRCWPARHGAARSPRRAASLSPNFM